MLHALQNIPGPLILQEGGASFTFWLRNCDQNRLWDLISSISRLAFSVQLRILDLNPVGSKVKNLSYAFTKY